MNIKFSIKTKIILYVILVCILLAAAVLLSIYQKNIISIKADQPTGFCNVSLAANNYHDMANFYGLAEKTKESCIKYSEEIPKVINFNRQLANLNFVVFSYEHDKNLGYLNEPVYALNQIV